MVLNEQQLNSIQKALNWYYLESHKKSLFVLAGLAGSGKSTVLRYIVEALGMLSTNILFTALTGRAVSILRLKGHLANTIHKTFYNARTYKNQVFFTKKTTIPSFIQLIVVDEFGMVGDSMINDILSFGIPVIGLGDPGQLNPLFEKNTFITEDKCDVFLDKVMRTDDTTGILDIAMIARNRQYLKPGVFKASRVLSDKKNIKPMLEYDKVLTWTNRTRRGINSLIRSELKFTDPYPVVGDRITFLVNRYDKIIEYLGIDITIVNGLDCDIVEDSIILNEHQILVKARPTFITDEKELYFEVECNKYLFDSYNDPAIPSTRLLMDIDRENNRDSIFCDFSHAITVTSSQGGSFGSILVLDEIPKWRAEYFRWMYTAVTRAELSVDVLLDQ